MDNQTIVIETEKTFSELLDTLFLVDDDQINIVPFEGSWTAGQLAQHIILSATGFVQLLNGPSKNTDRATDAHVAVIKAMFLDFNHKMKSPDFVVPPVATYHKAELMGTLTEIKTDLQKVIENLDLTKTYTAFEIPVMGYLTGTEATCFLIYHTQRHIHQLKNIFKKLN